MFSMPLRCFVFALVIAVVAGCQPAAPQPAAMTAAPPAAATAAIAPAQTIEPAAPAPTAAPAANGPAGQVVWNGAPVGGARLKLVRPGACRDASPDAVLAAVAADANGKFAFPAQPAGEWELCAAWPEGQAADTFALVPLEPDRPVKDITARLIKPVKLLAPDLAQPVAGVFEVRWESVAGVAGYRVALVDPGTSELILQQDVAGASLAVTQTLKPGRIYMLSVDGVDAGKQQVARFAGEFKTAGTPVAPEDEPVVQLPSSCYREGLLTYVDRTAQLCFAYPQGFTLGAAQGSQAQVEVRGPATSQGPEPLFASLTVEVRPYQGQDLAPFVDELLKTNVPAGFPAKVERRQVAFGGHAAEALEPMPGRLSSRQVVVDFAPQSLFVLTFWPSFRDTAPDQMTPEAQQAQRDMEALYEIVAASFATLPPAGVPIDPAARVDLPKSCLAGAQPLYVNTGDRYCFALTPQMTTRREANGSIGFYGPALDQSPEPLRAALGLTVEVAAKDITLDRLVEGYVASYKDLGPSIRRSTLTLGGMPALRLDGVPGRPTATEILMLHEGTLFQFRFTPDLSFEQTRNAVSGAIQAVMASFAFLPGPESPIASAGARPASYQGISFSYPAALASAARGETVPAEAGGSDAPWWVPVPEHAEVALAGYVLPQAVQSPRIVVYPAGEFATLNPQAAGRIAALRQLLETRPADPAGQLPFLPLFNAGQVTHLEVKYLSFANGQGVRYLTQYSQAPGPLTNQELFYTFQGLTADGRYYLAAILPVSHSLLPAGFASMSQAGREALVQNYAQYLSDITSALSAQPGDSFKPGLPDLDALVQSIRINP